MSDEGKSLSDDLNEMLGDAKESAKKAADKVSEKASELADEAKEFAGEAKEKAAEFSKEAKASAQEFADDAKEVFSDGKNVAVIAHLTLIGWIIALVMNSSNKTEFGSFYIRQYLGFLLLGLLTIIPFLGFVVALLLLVAWIMSLISALGGKMQPSWLLGKQFQEWFKSI
ncbi:YtxH domain-containing protein [Psychroserpens sp.]|uniref:YtxH domain-containing protein n=1 Tax=Psychroserpens sp. TaxID=2020870 RepID=UPI001B0FECB3|nr:YtxH domain-containing protein [Psychroserpens sp.]MBO6607721.1 YtxH domain-containing protein [Psychroserpens sp.]MBO6654712.1 YtxH domain-containing protein [Psychroserpens sp.]MBO6682864.1 YtxH domain-containing protein [Psychroserpens sp.]MBO6751079.1 YtxH domain-containing protein [Psychroserpens sp.]MBO6916352.1 YtxH domain-containing protein [Psychroserpens sp.]